MFNKIVTFLKTKYRAAFKEKYKAALHEKLSEATKPLQEEKDKIDARSGLTEKEIKIILTMQTLLENVKALNDLHPNDSFAIYEALHTIERVLATRAMCRLYPTAWKQNANK